MKLRGITGGRNVDTTRNFNRASVMKLVLENPGIDRTRLAEATGLTGAAVTRIVQELMTAELLADTGTLDESGGRGRRRTGLKIAGGGGYVLGLGIVAFNSSVALTDISGRTIDTVAVEPSQISDPTRTLDEITDAAKSLIKKHNLREDRVFAAGAAIAGYLDRRGEIWERSPYLGWPEFNIQRSLSQRLGLEITVENVNRCIAVAESRMGCCQGAREVLLVRAALGLGGAIISSGEILRGQNNQAGQIGHIPVDPDGAVCSCGKRGCLNTLASGSAILNELGIAKSTDASPGQTEGQERELRNVLSRSLENDKAAIDAIRRAGDALAKHCAGLIHSIDPQTIVLTGPLGRNSIYCDAFQTGLARRGIACDIVTAHETRITAPAQAASALALSTCVYSPSFDVQRLLAAGHSEGGEGDGGKARVL